ncbi:hypothetical protein BH10BAC5_BH10BAC5_23300 [soil metagenome]
MLSLHILQIIGSLKEEEIAALNDFIYSPYFNKSKTIQKLWEVVKLREKKLDDPDFSNQELFEIVFEGKKYNYGTMKNLIHSFSVLLEQFLEIQFHREDKFQVDYNTLVYSIVKYYPEFFNKKFSRIIKEFKKTSEGSDYHFLYKYQLSRLAASFAAIESKRDKILFEQGDALVNFFIIHLFQVYHNIKIYYNAENYKQKGNIIEDLLEILDLERIMEKIRTNNPKDFEIVNLYYNLYLSLKDTDNSENFFNFKKLLLKSRNKIHLFEFEDLANSFVNLMQSRSYSGIEGSQKEFADFYKFLYKSNIFFSNTESKISLLNFSLYLKNYFEALDTEYAKLFYNENLSKLVEKDKETIINFYLAYESYVARDFNKALEYSAKLKMDIDRFKITVKDLQLKCYFELNETESFKYTLDSFRKLIYRRGTINNQKKEYTKNYLNLINLLFEYKVFHKDNLDEIKIQISERKMLNKEWIIAKLKEIEER